MANPNPAVYGTSTEWINATELYTGGYTGTDELKNKIPQIRNAYSDRGDLWRYVRENLLEYDVPIDPTICPCGQDPTVSAYGKIDVYHNKQNIDQNRIPDYENIYENENINWFFGSLWSAGGSLRYCMNEIADKNQRWSPEYTDENYTNNNLYITPWVYYQTKSLLLRIRVIPLGEYPTTNSETYGSISLDEWKNNYSDKKIIGAFLEILGCSEYNNNIIGYTGPLQGGYGDYKSVNFSLLNAVNNGTSELTDYATYTFKSYNFVPLISRVVRGNGFQTAQYYYLFGYHNLDNYELQFNYAQDADTGYQIYPEISYSEHNYEQIMKMAACFGVPFTPTNKTSFNILFNDNDLYLPVIDENGIAHGEYTHGNDNLTNDLYTKDSIREYDYDPTRPPVPVDPNTYSNQTYFNPLINLASATKRYVLTAANVEQLMRDLWTISDSLVHTDPDEPYKDYTSIALDNFLVNSPIQCIVSLDKYPINNIPTGTQAEAIPLGKTTVPNGAIGKPLTKTTMEFNFASVDIFPRFGGCFLDYEPYTHYELYVPFCGTTQINASDILGHKLSVIEIVDFTTGTITAYIMADNLAISTISGNCAISIPLSGTDTTMINSEINNALITAKSTQLQSKLTGKVGGLIGNLPRTVAKTLSSPLSTYTDAVQDKWNTELADYNLNHIETPMHLIGSASPVGMWSLEMTCRLMCYYPTGDVINDSKPPSLIADKITEFGNMQGFATVDTGKVSDYHGFTMGALRTEGIACTESERQRLKALFATGVILP